MEKIKKNKLIGWIVPPIGVILFVWGEIHYIGLDQFLEFIQSNTFQGGAIMIISSVIVLIGLIFANHEN